MKREGHEGRVRGKRNAYGILIVSLKGRDHSEGLGVNSMIIFKRIIGKQGLECELYSSGSG
jgi:hypothetical protein